MAENFKFRFELNGLKLEEGKFTKAFENKVGILLRRSAREWLRAIITSVPPWTGFTQGSVVFARGMGGGLARYLNIAMPITPVSNRPKFYRHSDGRRYDKDPRTGGQFGRYTFPVTQHRYRFHFRSDVIYFYLNDVYRSISPKSPWRAKEAGWAAFVKTMRAGLGNLPQVRHFITKDPLVKQD